MDRVVDIRIGHNACDLSTCGVLKTISSKSDLQMGKKYSIEGYPGFYYTLSEIAKAEEMSALPKSIIKQKNPLLTVEEITPQTTYNINSSGSSILDQFEIDETSICRDERTPHTVIPLSRNNVLSEMTDVMQFTIPLGAVPQSVLDTMNELNCLPLCSDLTVFVSICPPSSWIFKESRFAVQFTDDLRVTPERCGSFHFIPLHNCIQIGNANSCVFQSTKQPSFLAYMGFHVTSFGIRAVCDIIINQDHFSQSSSTSSSSSSSSIQSFDTVHALLDHLSSLPSLQVLLLDLLSFLFYASNRSSFTTSLSTTTTTNNNNNNDMIAITIPLLRLMAITPVVRYIESKAIQYVQPHQPLSSSSTPTIPSSFAIHDDDEIDRECDHLTEKGVLSTDNRDEVADEIREFQNLGGKVVFHSPQHSHSFPIAIRPDDCIWSVCHEGCNRSQILCEGVAGIRRALASHPHVTASNQFCHGAVSGYDPREFFTELNSSNQYSFLHTDISPSDPASKAFAKVFGISKRHRCGEDLAHDLVLNEGNTSNESVIENRQFLFNYFSNMVWSMDTDTRHFTQSSSSSRTARTLIFLFYRAFPIVLHRIMENSSLDDNCFENLILISIPVIDPISHAISQQYETVYMACYEGYLHSLLCAEITPATTLSLSKNIPDFVIDPQCVINHNHHNNSGNSGTLSSDYVWVKSEGRDFVGVVMRGDRSKRARRWEYLQIIIHRLNVNAWPSAIKFARRLDSVPLANIYSNERKGMCDIYLFGPLNRDEVSSIPRMIESERGKWGKHGYHWMKAITEQVAYYHDLGIVVNSLMMDRILIYQNNPCLFDITHSIIDGFTMNASIYNPVQVDPLLALLSCPSIPSIPSTIFNYLQREWNKVKQSKIYPSICGDTVRLAVLWSLVLPWVGKEEAKLVKRVIDALCCDENEKKLSSTVLQWL